MFGFSAPSSVLGVDVGATSVKIVELKNQGGKPTLLNYAYSEEHTQRGERGLQLDVKKSAALIQELCQRAGITATQAVAAMPSYAVFTSVLNIPVGSGKPEELQQAVMWEAKKVIPLALEEMMLDWQVIESGAAGEKKKTDPNKSNTAVLLTGAPKNLVHKYIEVFKEADIRLVSLETEMFSMIRSLVGNDPATIALVDLGAVNTDIAIVERGLPLFTRSLDAGGIMVTKAVADALRVDFTRAEQFKFDVSMAGTEALAAEGGMPAVVKSTLAPIVNEIRYSLNLFQQENNKKIEKVILAGGGANLVGIEGYLTEVLAANVVIGDPWARISYPENLRPVLEEMGARMAIATGLALRETAPR